MKGITNDNGDDWNNIEWWLIKRKRAALNIDPETATVMWAYTDIDDPYGLKPPMPNEPRTFGRAFFARAPRGEVWVSFLDLPDEVREALWRQHWHNRFNDYLSIDRLFSTEEVSRMGTMSLASDMVSSCENRKTSEC